MNATAQRLAALCFVALLVTLQACTPLPARPLRSFSWPTIPHEKEKGTNATVVSPEDVASLLKIGDKVTITTTWRDRYLFVAYRVDPDGFAGLSESKRKYKVKYASLTQLVIHRDEAVMEYVVR